MPLVNKSFSDIITFTRSTGGGRFNAAGQYEWLPADQPRIDYDPVTGECLGLLIEGQRTNLLTYSSDFTNAAWTSKERSTWTTTQDAKFGSVGLLTEDLTVGSRVTGRFVLLTAGTAYTHSERLKAIGRSNARLQIFMTGSTITADFDLATGTYSALSGGSARIVPLGDGWFECSVTFTAAVTGSHVVRFYPIVDGQASYSGDGRQCFLSAGAQLEAGSFPTSLIPTTDAQVTRAADIASVNELSPWYNPEQGTLFVEAVPSGFAPSINTGWIRLDDGTTANFIEVRSWGPLKSITAGRNAGGVAGSVIEANNQLSIGTVSRVALTYDATTGSLAAGGDLLGSATYSAFPAGINRLIIGRRPAGATFSGHIRSIRYYPRRLSNESLVELTTP